MKLSRLAPAALLALALGLGAAWAADAPEGPVAVTNYGKKGVVTFDHAKHAGQECASCHHQGVEGKARCGECHRVDEHEGAPAIKDAMHKKDLGVCYACHLQSGAENKLKCADCHGG